MCEKQLLLLLTSLVTLSAVRGEVGNAFVQVYDCTCLGYSQVYDCTVFGGGSTIWSGTAFDCQPNEIHLRHSKFINSTAIGGCSNGKIVANSVSVDADYYTSRLNITIEQNFINKTVECVYSNPQVSSPTLIGQTLLTISKAPYEPPSDLHIERITQDLVVFSWSPLAFTCLSIQYVITSVNCGVCPNITTETTVTCVQLNAEYCGSVVGNRSDFITIHLTLPSPPRFRLKLHQFSTIPDNMTVEIKFNKSIILLSEGVDGSPFSYNIKYSDFTSGRPCGLFSIQSTSCSERTCNQTFKVTPPCSLTNYTSFSLSSTNVFGDGPFSDPVIVSLASHDAKQDRYNSVPEIPVLLPVSAVMSALVIAAIISFIICTVVNIKLYKDKSQLLKTVRSQNSDTMVVPMGDLHTTPEYYEELDMYQVSSNAEINTNENSAYSIKRNI